jgi:nucleotide-binding universal stress UspA family protein
MSILIATAYDDGLIPLTRLACSLVPGEDVELVHVVPMQLRSPELATAREALRLQAQSIAGAAPHVEPTLLTGDPVAALLQLIAIRQPQLIVLGGSTRAVELGPVAQAIVAEAKVPVLAARGLPDELPWPMHIAVGVDLTPASGPAVAWAERVQGGRVTLLHAWSPAEMSQRLGHAVSDDAPEVLASLRRDVRSAAGRADAEVELVAVPGGESLTHVLFNRAVEIDADLLVFGTHVTGFGNRVTGKLLGDAIHDAPLPVVAVPDHAWDRVVPTLRRVLVAVDFSEASGTAVPYAFAMAGPAGEVHLAHVFSHRFNPERAEQRAAEFRIRLTALVPNAGRWAGTHVSVHALDDADPVGRICALAEELAVDAIVVGAVPHNPLWGLAVGSFVQDLTAKTHRPVLVVRPQDA